MTPRAAMRPTIFFLATASLLLGTACSGSDVGTSSDEEALKAKAPIPYVLQWVGEYDGDGTGDVDWIVMRRTGTFAASVNGSFETGRFVGPSKYAGQWPLKIAFITHGDYFVGTISQWSDANGNAVMTIDHYGTTQTVTAPWQAGGETMCDDTNGAWGDDEVNADGLYCTCPSTQKWIPSAGGCVK